MKTRNLTVMFTDMKEFTSRTSRGSRAQVEHLLTMHDNVIRPIFGKFEGTVIKTIGDAFLVTFESPTDAVLCGIKIQETVTRHNKNALEAERFEVRVAINSGEVHLKDNDIFGEPVNIAARIEAIAEPNEIYFTEAVYLTMNKNEIPSSEVGSRHLKGIPEQVRVYKVLRERTSPLKKSKQRDVPVAGARHATPGDAAPAQKIKVQENTISRANSKAITYMLVGVGVAALIIALIIFGIVINRRKQQQNKPLQNQPARQLEQQLRDRVENVIKDERR